MSATKPYFSATIINVGQNEAKYYTDVGAAWLHENGKGFTVKIFPNLIVNKFSLFVSKENQESFQKIGDRLNVNVVEKRGDDTYWHRIGSAFAHSKGYNIVLDEGVSAMGELVVMLPKEREQPQQ